MKEFTDTKPKDCETARFRSLDGLRGVAACLVMAGHMGSSTPWTNSRFFYNTYFLVDFFFVLSGFVIAWNYGDRLHTATDLRDFAVKRLARLYPLHLATLVALFAVEAFQYLYAPHLLPTPAFTGTEDMASLPQNLLLLQAMPFGVGLTWNQPAWSVSTELWAYLAYALICVSIGARTVYLLVAIPALAVIFALANNGSDSEVAFWLFARCLAGFFIGVVACQAFRHIGHLKVPRALLTAAEVVAFGGLLAFVAWSTGWSMWIHALTAACVFVFAFDAGMISALLRTRLLQFLGVVSYSIYMVHQFVLTVAEILVNRLRDKAGIDLWLPGSNGSVYGRSMLESAASILFLLSATIALSYFTFRFIELPARQWASRWAARRA
ncbi:MAG: acyltransferase [Pseudomonadota bacterium]